MKSLSSNKKQEKGQGLVEYALILVLVAIVVIAALMILGPIIGNVFSKVNSSLSVVSSGGTPPTVPGHWVKSGFYLTQSSCTVINYTWGTGSSGVGCYINGTP